MTTTISFVNKLSEKNLKKMEDGLKVFTFDPTIPKYYHHLGWKTIGMDEFKSKQVTVMERWI